MVKLFNNNREREMYDNMADLYSIMKTTEALEKAYVRDAITAEEYVPFSVCLFACLDWNTVLLFEGILSQ